MNVKVLEQNDDKLKIELDDLTLVNLLHENLWKTKIDYSAYVKDHPYLSQPVLVVKSKDPKKSLTEAADKIIDDCATIKKKFGKSK
ncbi:MAG: RpoL/Rpb11 RNA polymerase subunit family protein [Candidatus Aenigmatarchaeota archaeon]